MVSNVYTSASAVNNLLKKFPNQRLLIGFLLGCSELPRSVGFGERSQPVVARRRLGFLWVPMPGFLWVSKGSYAWVPLGSYGYLCLGSYDFRPGRRPGFLWVLMPGFLWVPVGSYALIACFDCLLRLLALTDCFDCLL